MHSWLHDLRFGVRMLRKDFRKSALAILAMAVAIGACTAVFSIVDGLLLKPLSFRDPERLVIISDQDRASNNIGYQSSSADFIDWRRMSKSFETMVAGKNASFTLTGLDEPETPLVRCITAGYFEMLGVQPYLGRTFAPEEDRPGGPAVAILSYELWQRQFGGDQAIVGKSVELDGKAHQIVAVMPPGFDNPLFRLNVPPQVWVPLALSDTEQDRKNRLQITFARLKPGVSVDAAQQEMSQIAAELAKQYPKTNERVEALVTSANDVMVRDVRLGMIVLFCAVLFVLLATCANVANLLLAKALARRQEMAIRRALGASVWRLLRQLLAESLTLAGLGGILGVLLAYWGLEPLIRLVPTGLNLPHVTRIAIDSRVLGFTVVVTLLTGVVFGLVPLLHVVESRLQEVLGAGSMRAIDSLRSRRIRGLLVILEVSLSLVLLVGAALMLRSLVALTSLDPGFDPHHLLFFRVSVRGASYETDAQRVRFYQDVVERFKAIPGAESAAAMDGLPFVGFGERPIAVDGREPSDPANAPRSLVRIVAPGVFETLRVPILQGRSVTEQDTADAAPVVVINAVLAQKLWPNGQALGERLLLDGPRRPRTIVGIVGNVRSDSEPPEPFPVVYVPHAQREGAPPSMALMIRTAGDPRAVLDEAKAALRNVDRGMPLYLVQTMDDIVWNMDWQARFTATLLGMFSALALGLAITGIYAVISYNVSQRTREIGVRMALGARPRQVVAMVLRGALGLAGTGIGIGLFGAAGLTRLLVNQLYGVTAFDGLTYAAAAALLAAVSVVASATPAMRAARIDPIRALRES